jgi:DNA/RNA endonuclease YhcR with UshA esterase domain
MKSRFLILAGLLIAAGSAQVIPIDSVRKVNANGVPVDSGNTVHITGIFSATSQFGGSGPAFVQDNTGGVAIYDADVAGFAIGDSVTVTAVVDFYRGLTELKSATITLAATGKTPMPRTLQAAHMGDTANSREVNEGMLAKIRGVFDTTGVFLGNRSYPFRDASGRGTVYIDSSVSDILNKMIPRDTIDLYGCVSQYDASSPFFSGYQLMPRSYADVSGTPGSNLMTIADAFVDTVAPITEPDRLGQVVTVTGIVTVPSGVLSATRTDIYIQDRTAGVDVFDFDYRELKLGDSLVVTGTVDIYNGKPELTSPQIVIADSNHPVPAPTPTTCQEMDQTRNLLGSLVVISGASATSLIVVQGSNTLLDNTGSAEMYVGAQSGVAGLLLAPDTFSVIGVKSQYDASPPYTTGCELIPRFRSDFSRTLEQESLKTIAEVQKPGADGYSSKYEGQYVKVQGRITGPNYIFSSGSSKSFYLQDTTNGINVYAPSYDSISGMYADSLGALFECVGKVTEYNGLTELANGSLRLLDDTLRPVEPVTLPFNGLLSEAMESRLITVTGDVITPPAAAGGGTNFTMKNGNPGIDVRIVTGAGIPLDWVVPGKRVQVTGIVGQYTSTYPFADGYQVMPRFRTDLVDVTAPESLGLQMKFASVEPEVFNPSGGQVCDIKLQSPGARKLYLQVFDLEGRLVKELLTNVPGHYYEVFWDGTDSNLERLPIGSYILNLKGVRDDGKLEVQRKLVVLGTRLK